MKADPERGMYCISYDEDEPIELIGEWFDDNYARMEILFSPCNYVHNQVNDYGDSVSPECVPDLQAQIDYIGQPEWVLYVNHERINPDKFNDESIERTSLIKNQNFSETIPNWI